MSVRQRLIAALCAALAAVTLTRAGWAQDVPGANLKAAYIYQFALFTEWPADALPQSGPLTMCVVGDTAVRDSLERLLRTAKKPSAAARSFVVAFGQPGKPPSPCHTMYVSGVSSADAARVVEGVRQLPVLTMSDIEGFNRMGGIAEFFFEAGTIRFAIRPDAVAQSHLQLSSALLRLARPSR